MSPSSPSIFSGTFPRITTMLCDLLASSEVSSGWFSAAGPQVLVPSNGAANEIARGLLARFRSGFGGIVFHTPETLARSLVNASGSFPHVATDSERSLAFRVACNEIHHPLTQALGAEALFQRSYRDIRDTDMSVDEFEARAARGRVPLSDPQRILIRIARLYEKYLSQLGALDPADFLSGASELLRRGAPIAPQIVFGFYDLTGVQQSLILALRDAHAIDSIYLPVPLEAGLALPPYSFANRAVTLLTSGRDVAAGGPVHLPDIGLREFATPHDEFRETCRAVRRLLDSGVSASEVGIAVRSIEPRDAARLERYAQDFEFALRRRSARPLRSQRIGRSILRLLRLRSEDFPRSRVFQLLRDGFRAGSESDRGIDSLDRLTRRHHVAGGDGESLDRTLSGLAIREPESAARLDAYRSIVGDLEQLCAPWSEPMSGADWRKVLAVLLQRFRLETEEDLAAAAEIEAIGELVANGQRFSESFGTEIIAAAIESADLVEGPSGLPGEVWFGDVMALRGRSFGHLFLIAVQEDRFPQGRTPDPLLPDRLRETVGLRTIGDGRSEEELLFQLAIDAALESVTLSRARSDGFGKLLRPSVFLQRMARPEAAAEGKPFPESASEKRARVMHDPAAASLSPALRRRIRLALSTGQASQFDGIIPVDQALATAIRGRLAATSPTYFEDFGECPQRFLFRRLLHADEIEDPEHEPQLNRRDKGSLDHAILETFYRGLPAASFDEAATRRSLPDTTRALLHQAIDREFDRLDEESPPYNETMRRIDRAMTRSALERFVAHDLADLAEQCLRPEWFEYSFGTDRHGAPDYPNPVVLDLGHEQIGFRGTIDRIDSTPGADGPFKRYRVVDYKSARASSYRSLRKKIDSGHKLQLALYAVAIEHTLGLTPEQISGIIKPFIPNGGAEQFGFQLAETRERLIDNLSHFVSAILAGRFPAYPDDEGSCRYCPLNHSCRTRHDTSERRTLRRTESVRDLLAEWPE
ncbi:MAG: PD-(D/E)XK nuclease family protein [Acidobacteriota bacterium]